MHPANIYLCIVNNRNTRARCEVCSNLTTKAPEQPRSSVSIIDFEQVNICYASILTNIG